MATGGHESLPRHSRCSGTGAMMCPCLFASAGVFRKGRCPRRRGDAQEAICPAMGAPIRQGVRAMGPMYSEKANRPAITRDLRGMTVRGRAAPAREAVCPAMGMPTRQGVWEMSGLPKCPTGQPRRGLWGRWEWKYPAAHWEVACPIVGMPGMPLACGKARRPARGLQGMAGWEVPCRPLGSCMPHRGDARNALGTLGFACGLQGMAGRAGHGARREVVLTIIGTTGAQGMSPGMMKAPQGIERLRFAGNGKAGNAVPAQDAVCPVTGMPTRQGTQECPRHAEMPRRPARTCGLRGMAGTGSGLPAHAGVRGSCPTRMVSAPGGRAMRPSRQRRLFCRLRGALACRRAPARASAGFTAATLEGKP